MPADVDMNQTIDPATVRPLGERIRYTFTAPARIADDFRRDTRWLDVLVISTAVAILSVYLLPQEFFLEQMEDAVDRRGRPVEITSSPAEIARWGRYLGMLTALVSHPLFALALAGILTLLFTVLAGGTTSFRQHLAITSHAFLVTALGALLAPLLHAATGDPAARFSPGLLLPQADTFPVLFLDGLDLFSLWMLCLAGYWAGHLAPRVGPARGIAALVGLYLALNALTAALVS
jgi:hypothetical protein